MYMATKQQYANAADGPRFVIKAGPEKAKNEFLKEVAERQEYWKTLANLVLQKLEGLRSLDPAVDTTITHRIKEQESLQTKIEKLQRLNKCLDLEAIHNTQWDIVGIRICVYFPRQLEQVKSFIEDDFKVIWQPSRDRALNQEIADGSIMASVPEGFTPARHFDERNYQVPDPESRPYKERMGYYEADHYWVQLREEDSEAKKEIPHYNNEAVEIQVRTVLMHAWAEVRHDLDYKPTMGLPTEDELRILDAIKGTIASCEIMQDVLFITREQRIKADATPFGIDSKKSWSAVIDALKPGHRILLEDFETGKPEKYGVVMSLFALLEIKTPGELKKKLINLDSSWTIRNTIHNVRSAFSKAYSLYYHTEDEYMPQPKQPSLFEFLAVYILSTDDANIDIRISHSVKVQETYRSMTTIPKTVENSQRVAKGLPPKGYFSGGKEDIMVKEKSETRAARWYGIICTILYSLKNHLKVMGDEREALPLGILSTTWHVHEWIAANFQDTETHPRVEEVVGRLLEALRECGLPALTDLVEWTIRVTSYFRWEDSNTEYREGRPHSHLIHTTNWVKAKHRDVFISPEEWESEAWTQGEQLAAEIIGIKTAELKNATLFRAVFQNHCNEEYVRHCLAHDEIDIHWKFGCGKSILGATAMFGSPDTCKMMLQHPKIDARKLPAPDGLSLLHIAVIHENYAMVEELMSNCSLRQDTLWNRAKRDVYWSGHVTLESLTSKRQEVGAWCVPKGGWGKSSYKKVHSRTPQSVSRSSTLRGRQIDITRAGSESKEDGWTAQQIAGLLLGRPGKKNNKNLQDSYKLLPP
jgi:ppGpp synthetase/RelA/SpoT-type nucleotidyltranferase